MPRTRLRKPQYPPSRTVANAADLGLAMRAQRRAAGMPIDKAAVLLGVSKQFLSDVENGKPTVQLGKALAAAQSLGLALDFRRTDRTSGPKSSKSRQKSIAHPGSHLRREQQGIALHRAVARKLLAEPDRVISRAQANMQRWLGKEPREGLYGIWRILLRLPPAVIAEVITSDSEAAAQLRQSSPFTGVLSQAERDRILEPFYRRAS